MRLESVAIGLLISLKTGVFGALIICHLPVPDVMSFAAKVVDVVFVGVALQIV